MYILDSVKYILNQDLDLLKQSPLDEYDEGRFNTIQDLINFIRAQEACFNEEKFLKKHGFKEPEEAQEMMVMERYLKKHGFRNRDGERARERVMQRYLKEKRMEE